MDADTVVTVGRQAMEVTMLLAAPILLSSLVVGLLIAMFQAVTQINEMTLSFVPKLIVVAVVMMVAGSWMLSQITGFMRQLVENIPYLIG
ncbi:MAG: flagellar biosynthesis protein FliQ [Gammaproteobacteria bacterium]|nr:flagellar biosynthesis protein FliQ [Gammaproteobacteria bacterium]MCP5298851.1 flagellar biosynthesis protein FliQ [Chromatiaceae bacterium]